MPVHRAILFPIIAMVVLTGLVWVRLYKDRIGEMRARGIHPQKLATSRQMAETMQNTQAADHFRNLFEMPVLFYVLCALLAISQLTTPLLLACAWGYVVLRAYHAYIHLTHNKVIRRFQAYVASCLVLFLMWGVFALELVFRV
jgi:hypothetical protein